MGEFPCRKHPRLPTYDYSQPGAYFVTVCTRDRKPLLCRRRAGCPHPAELPPGTCLPAEAVFTLTRLGQWTDAAIRRCETVYPNVQILSYVIMPDHWHLLFRILPDVEMGTSPSGEVSAPCGGMRASRPTIEGKTAARPVSVPQLVRAIKTSVSRRTGRAIWQGSFYDRILRSEAELREIDAYIRQNPQTWLGAGSHTKEVLQ